MHKLFRGQLEQALEQLEFPSDTTTTNFNSIRSNVSSSPNDSSKPSYRHQLSLSPLKTKTSPHTTRVKQSSNTSVVDQHQIQNDVREFSSSLNALDDLHEKLKMYSQENRKLKLQLEGKGLQLQDDNQYHRSYHSDHHNNENRKKIQGLDYENFKLKKEKEELMVRVEEFERKIQELESRAESERELIANGNNNNNNGSTANDIIQKITIIDDNEHEQQHLNSSSSSSILTLGEKEDLNELIDSVDDLLILVENNGQQHHQHETLNLSTFDFSMQCSLLIEEADPIPIEKKDQETNTELDLSSLLPPHNKSNSDDDKYVFSIDNIPRILYCTTSEECVVLERNDNLINNNNGTNTGGTDEIIVETEQTIKEDILPPPPLISTDCEDDKTNCEATEIVLETNNNLEQQPNSEQIELVLETNHVHEQPNSELGLIEQIEALKQELSCKNDIISKLNQEKDQYKKNEQEHEKVMTHLTSHVKALVKESALLRLEYNSSIQKLKEELLANNKQM